ncbi:Translation initiation factor eIF-2B subunit alpha [Smittium mucronatum]|uniref:Translation initiation factor eIF2B subunit alpha n=1 Tax=Smittium mucronatum TaxID=133383 RepID=A0A1R0H6W7_9FUNG|nr:Translation initiation factor eIF-2B subunit alpha [Smittium mucronatum]
MTFFVVVFGLFVVSTISELILKVHEASDKLIKDSNNAISMTAGCAVFLQVLNRLSQVDIMVPFFLSFFLSFLSFFLFFLLSTPFFFFFGKDLDKCRRLLIESGEGLVQKASQCREIISNLSSSFIRDNMVILVHSHSRVVMGALHLAAKQNVRFSVYITESRPDCSGLKTAQELQELGIPCKVILDASIGYIMEKVDLVLVGAEGVVENGGLINKIGSYQLALIAKAAGKPLYALAESYKFVRFYPLNQYDFSSSFQRFTDFESTSSDIDWPQYLEKNSPSVDYTPPEYINFLFTDLGIFTPAAVSDELIKFYLD